MNDQQQPAFFPEDLNARFEQYLPDNTLSFRDLPIGDYKITSFRSFKTKDLRDCMVLTLSSKDQTMITVYAPDRLRDQLILQPNTFKYLRNQGLQTSNSTGNQYFNFQLA